MKAAKEGALPPQPISETAATRGKRLFKASGAMDYRVTLSNGGALLTAIVNAKTGDEAAARALTKHPGCKVAHVAPDRPENFVAAEDDEYFDAEAA